MQLSFWLNILFMIIYLFIIYDKIKHLLVYFSYIIVLSWFHIRHAQSSARNDLSETSNNF